jgi:hypothetical protein
MSELVMGADISTVPGNLSINPTTTTLQESDKPSNDKLTRDNVVPPTDDKYDWIQLGSGEWLKGKLNALYNFSLEFDSDELGLLSQDWDNIKKILTAKEMSVRIEDRDQQTITVIGILTMNGNKVEISSDEDITEFDKNQIVSIARGAKGELKLWTGKVSIGVNIRGGNSDLVDSNFIVKMRRRTAETRFVTDYIGNYSSVEGLETSNNHRVNAYHDKFISGKLFWRTLTAEYIRDVFKNIEHQASIGTAFGYNYIRTSKTEWNVAGGLGAVYKKYVSVQEGKAIDSTSPSLGLGARYETEYTSWLNYLLVFSFNILDEDLGSYTHHLLTTLSSDLVSNLDLEVSFIWDHIQDPQPAANGTTPRQDDYQLIVGISYEI